MIIFSHGLYGHCDLHAAIARLFARSGYVVVVLEHEGRAASYCKTEGGQELTYLFPPPLTPEAKASYAGYLGFCRDFRAPILAHREREIAATVRCLRGAARLLPLSAEGNPFPTPEAAAAASGHLDKIVQNLDLDRLTMAGHSFGGATAVVAAQSGLEELAEAFNACLLFDPWSEPLTAKALETGLGALPTLCVLSEAFSAEAGNKFAGLTEALLRPDRTDIAVSAVLPGTKHAWVSDVPLWLPGPLARLMGQAGPLDSEKALEATVAASLDLLSKPKAAGGLDVESYGMRRIFRRQHQQHDQASSL